MHYSNSKIPEGINTSKSNPLWEFFILSAGIIAIVFIIITLLIVVIDNYADKIPFETEKSIAAHKLIISKSNTSLPPYLKSIADRVINNSNLPEDMSITVHYINSNTVNAFATLGGHIVVFRGILEKLSTEEEIAMLLAHEVGHVKNRHPILSASHGVVIGIALAFINSSLGSQSFDLLGSASSLTLMRYSREFEYQADKHAIDTLIKIYGNAEGAIQLFSMFQREADNRESFEMFSTHPLTTNRISRSQMLAENVISGATTAIPTNFIKWLESEKTNLTNRKHDEEI